MGEMKVGVIGLGGRGYGLLQGEILKMPELKVMAVCDIYEDRVRAGYDLVKKVCGNAPLMTQNYKDVISCADVDAVLIFTSWEDHIKIAIESMEAGKFTAMEVGGAYSVDDCWALVDTYEKTKTPLMMLENCCFGRYELMALNMVRQGLFGEIVHCAGGYMHDLRYEVANGEKNRHYRLNNYINRNCENYPTHELGPIAKILNINNGNRMLSLVSYASKACGLKDYLANKKCDEKLKKTVFKQGDVVTTLIDCENGETITLTLDTTLPRPYSRAFTIRGTKGMYQEDGNMVFLDKKHSLYHDKAHLLWGNGKKYAKKFDHRIWKNAKKLNMRGHGGMDTMVFRAMYEAYSQNTTPAIDVYDTASWMVITALSEKSISECGMKQQIPDFTRGRYKNRTDIVKGDFNLE